MGVCANSHVKSSLTAALSTGSTLLSAGTTMVVEIRRHGTYRIFAMDPIRDLSTASFSEAVLCWQGGSYHPVPKPETVNQTPNRSSAYFHVPTPAPEAAPSAPGPPPPTPSLFHLIIQYVLYRTQEKELLEPHHPYICLSHRVAFTYLPVRAGQNVLPELNAKV